jgi:hypothetical protein
LLCRIFLRRTGSTSPKNALAAIAAAPIMEIAVGTWIHDNLTLDVLMPIAPSEAIKAWPMAI